MKNGLHVGNNKMFIMMPCGMVQNRKLTIQLDLCAEKTLFAVHLNESTEALICASERVSKFAENGYHMGVHYVFQYDFSSTVQRNLCDFISSVTFPQRIGIEILFDTYEYINKIMFTREDCGMLYVNDPFILQALLQNIFLGTCP